MKYTVKALIVILFLFLSGNVFAVQKSEIRLSDGSVFYGEIIAVNSGLYVIKTESIGTVKINKSKIASISFGSFSTPEKKQANSETNDIKEQTASLTRVMKNDKDTMSSIMSLQNHPDFKAVLNDSTILEAINSGNINQLLSNPKIQKLMNNQTVKDISRQLPK